MLDGVPYQNNSSEAPREILILKQAAELAVMSISQFPEPEMSGAVHRARFVDCAAMWLAGCKGGCETYRISTRPIWLGVEACGFGAIGAVCIRMREVVGATD